MNTTRIRTLVPALLAALALFATACGGGSAGGETASVDAAAAAAAAPAADEAAAPAEDMAEEAAPPISLVANSISGDQIDFGSLAGQDVVLWFWAPW